MHNRFLHRSVRVLGCLLVLVTILGFSFAFRPKRKPTSTSYSNTELVRRLSMLEKVVEQKRKRLHIPGLAVVVVHNDSVVYLKGFGLRDVERGLPVTPDTLFGIGSCTKAFTGMAAVMSADDGKLSLDDSPRKYLGYVRLLEPEANQLVTLRDLLSHRTGLAPSDAVWRKDASLSREQVIRAVMQDHPTGTFRQTFQYHNVMYAAAGECVAKSQTTTWEDFVNRRIFQPLSMTRSNTSPLRTQHDLDNAVGYQAARKQPRREEPHDLANVAPAGGISSTAKDMGQWIRLCLGGGSVNGKQLVSESSFREIFTPNVTITDGWGYGLGWELGNVNIERCVIHAGGAVGHAALTQLFPEKKLGRAGNVNMTPPFREITSAVAGCLSP
jgi:CubicO group peptidase (beta-lactamase class C family)